MGADWMQAVATMIANVADTTATERPLRRPSRNGHRVAAVYIMLIVLPLVRLALLLFTGGRRDMGRILIGTMMGRPASECERILS
jgi:hypothetical protein